MYFADSHCFAQIIYRPASSVNMTLRIPPPFKKKFEEQNFFYTDLMTCFLSVNWQICLQSKLFLIERSEYYISFYYIKFTNCKLLNAD